MKTASVQHISTLGNTNGIYNTYKIDYSALNRISTYIMKKLTNVSPFILLLVPVFMMMVFTVTTNVKPAAVNEVAMKAKAQSTLALQQAR